MSPDIFMAAWGRELFILFLSGLALALLLSGAIALWLPILLRRFAPHASIRLRLGLVVLLVIFTSLFTGIAFHISPDSALSRWDAAFNRTLHASATPYLVFFTWLTHLGDPLVLAMLCILVGLWLFTARYPALAIGYVMTVAANGLLNRLLKALFERTRPLHEDGIAAISGWSFPSGHSSGTIVAYGMLAYVCMRVLPAKWRLPAVLLATSIIYMVGWSRVFLNHHYISDVTAGMISGSICIIISIAILEHLRHRVLLSRDAQPRR